MAHYQATIEYDGTDFYGFQRQARARSVQGVMEAVLARFNGGEPVTVRGAGRTDTGVHATGQVIDFRLTWRKDEAELLRALNAMLPPDVAVRNLALAPEGFHARYDALSRAYCYTLLTSSIRQPLLHRTSFHVRHSLDTPAMDRAVRRLLGERDFATFGRATTDSGSTTRVLLAARVWQEGELVHVGVEANGFLFRMVRGIVAALLEVGQGRRSPEWMDELLAARDRAAVGGVIAPRGLCLVGVRYAHSSPDHLFS